MNTEQWRTARHAQHKLTFLLPTLGPGNETSDDAGKSKENSSPSEPICSNVSFFAPPRFVRAGGSAHHLEEADAEGEQRDEGVPGADAGHRRRRRPQVLQGGRVQRRLYPSAIMSSLTFEHDSQKQRRKFKFQDCNVQQPCEMFSSNCGRLSTVCSEIYTEYFGFTTRTNCCQKSVLSDVTLTAILVSLH